ncbi:hypothetical protein TNCV_193131 [Trichonephila clavipes]|nr:hypothetical protein TNCV_193131 [Trichonephila clavipes]
MVATPLIPAIQLVPYVFSRIKVWSLDRPVQSVHRIVIIPNLGGPHNMTSGVVMLEVTMIQPVKLPQRSKNIVA